MEYDQPERMDAGMCLSILLAYAGDPPERDGLIARVSERTGVPFEKIEELFQALIEILVKRTRSN